MHVPPHYRPPDPEAVREEIRANPLAALTTAVDGVPQASHVPVILPDPGPGPDSGAADDLVLAGHLNRGNPQWRAVCEGAPALLVFTGPHGYVSPAVTGLDPAAPTWNFTAVHVSGRLVPVPQGDPTLEIIRDTVRAFEGRFGRGWDMTSSQDYFRRLLPGVGAFRLRADNVQAMFKLSQDQDEPTRAATADSFGSSTCDAHRRLAGLMERSAR